MVSGARAELSAGCTLAGEEEGASTTHFEIIFHAPAPPFDAHRAVDARIESRRLFSHRRALVSRMHYIGKMCDRFFASILYLREIFGPDSREILPRHRA